MVSADASQFILKTVVHFIASVSVLKKYRIVSAFESIVYDKAIISQKSTLYVLIKIRFRIFLM